MQFNKALKHTIVWKTLNTGFGFFINLLIVRLLGATASGNFFYAITALSFFTLLISWSLEAGITYYASNNKESLPSISFFILPLLLVQGLISWSILRFIPLGIDTFFSFVF